MNSQNQEWFLGSRSAAETTREIVQEKFRSGESVVTLLETYQIIGSESPNRLLALVTSHKTFALFSFSVSRLPPRAFSDLTVDNIFPLNESFKIITSRQGKISKLQFEVVSASERSEFYYYPYSPTGLNDFEAFNAFIDSARAVMGDASLQGLDFAWLNNYKREDFKAIDRCIADGSKPLKKGESKFQDELKKHEHEYIVYKGFRIYCATWNINGQPCNGTNLRAWLAVSDEPPDIYAVALQELDLSPKAITFSESRPDPIWVRKIMDNLHPDAVYEELISVRLVGMMLTIVVKKELRQNVTRCWTQTVGTGALNIMGNKGGVGVSITINEADLCFVNSHLAAHVSEVYRRNEDFDEIMKRLVFDETNTRRLIDNHDHIFWIGDLNYRIKEFPTLPSSYNNYKELLEHDQLREQMSCGRVFCGFTEGEINFRPTYKYDPGTDNYDSSEKSRAPAWCDRILWKGNRIKQLTYNSVMEIRLSDHKPVYSILLTEIKTKDEKKYKRVHEEVLKRVDKYENDNQPQITVEKTDIDFDIINFNEKITRDFTVANNCHLPVTFKFIKKNDSDARICEDWLDIEPKSGNLITGTSLSIRITVLVDSTSVWQMHQKLRGQHGKIPLDILVLHVEDGRDIFITIMGQYKPSCFGFSVDILCRTDRPINDYTLAELWEIEKSVDITACKVTMPREIFLLIDYLYENAKDIHDLFSSNRLYRKNLNINEIRYWLDTWSKDPFPGTPHTAAEALLMLLEAPSKPLLYPKTDDLLKTESYIACLQYLKQLTTPRKNVFLHLCMFLKHGIEQRLFNAAEAISLFGCILLKKRKVTDRKTEDQLKSAKFMEKFINGDLENFLCVGISVE